MSFDYANARLRARKSRLLSQDRLVEYTWLENLPSLLTALTDTGYRRAVDEALTRASGLEALFLATHLDLVENLRELHGFFDSGARQWVDLVLRGYDLHNLKTILRGLSLDLPVEEIDRALIPIGELTPAVLDELIEAGSPREVVDRLASLGSPFARPLLSVRAERPGAPVFELELALERWHDEQVRQRLAGAPGQVEALRAAQDMEADLANMLTALRFAHSPEPRSSLLEQIGYDEVEALFIGPGEQDFSRLSRAADQDSVPQAVDVLARPPYAEPLETGLNAYRRDGRLSDIEDSLWAYRLAWRSKQILKDPLGIGVTLGYLALKINEVRNLRWIAMGIYLNLPAREIREGLVFAG